MVDNCIFDGYSGMLPFHATTSPPLQPEQSHTVDINTYWRLIWGVWKTRRGRVRSTGSGRFRQLGPRSNCETASVRVSLPDPLAGGIGGL